MSITNATSHIALVALLAAGPTALLAQTATETVPPADGAIAPADGTMTDAAPVAEPEVPPQPVEGQITMQGENTALASDLLGSSVFSSTDEAIGDISDMIVNLDGSIEGVVIGVGGFLGLGQKAVAIEMSSLTVTTDENGDTRLQSAATRQDLEAAPEFMSMEDQMAAEQAAQPADATVPATDGASVPAEGDAAMPAEGDAAMPAEGDAEPAEGTTGTAPSN